MSDWENLLLIWNESPIHAKTLFKLTFSAEPLQVLDQKLLSKNLKIKVDSQIDFSTPAIAQIHTSADGTQKCLLGYGDNNLAEAAILNFHKRKTFCLSSQIGCAMKCSFCLTGTKGLKRNLSTSEIVGQYKALYYFIRKETKAISTPQIVFMGEGEPLHNFDNIKKALQILTHPLSFNLGPKNITLSSVGLVHALKRWNELPNINFAFSLHAANQVLREKIIPTAVSNPLDQIMECIDKIAHNTQKLITFEYILIDEINTSDAHIDELIKLLRPRKNYAILNLIPFNSHPCSSWKKPTLSRTTDICNHAASNEIRTFIRKTKGLDINAACGQLKGAGVKNREPISPQLEEETSVSPTLW